FVVVWESYSVDGSLKGIAGRRYTNAGAPLGASFVVNSYTTGHQEMPVVRYDAGGGFVVAWESLDQDGSNYGVYARRFTKAGAPLGLDFRVNGYTTNKQDRAAIALGRNLVVVWTS